MDASSINSVIIRETQALRSLLIIMEEQNKFLMENNFFGLEEIVERLGLCNKGIAEVEVERRNLVNGASMKAVLAELNDDELYENYRSIQKLLHAVKLQQENNDMLIKLGLGFSTKMLNILNPDKKSKTYNSYGKLKR